MFHPGIRVSKTKWLVIPLLVLFCLPLRAQMDYEISFDVTLSGTTLTVVPMVSAPTATIVRYKLTSQKSGQSGRSVTRQSGTAKLDGVRPTPLSRLSLSVGPMDRYTITLRLFQGAELVGEKTMTYPLEERT